MRDAPLGGRPESGLVRIGTFARLGGVTVKTLRHYEFLGLIQPAVTDRGTSYRYYRVEQLEQLNAIVTLATAGVPLKVIPLVLEADAEARAAQLRSVRVTLVRHAEQTQETLELIDDLISEAEADQMGAPRGDHGSVVLMKCEPARPVRSLRTTVHTYADVDHLFEELAGHMRDTGSVPVWGAVWHNCVPGRIQCEIVADTPLEIGTWSRRLLPATMVASTTYHGDAEWRSLYSQLHRWIAVRGGKPVGPAREWYYDGPKNGVTEIQIPFRSRTASTLLLQPLRQ